MTIKPISLEQMVQPAVEFGKCVICGGAFHKEFPSDFPDEWKFCCFCKSIADIIVEGTMEEVYLLGVTNAIKNRITLVKGNVEKK